MDFEFIKYEKRDHIAIVTFNRPDRLNALGRQLTYETSLAQADFAEDDNAWVLIYTGAGRAFSAGADLKEMAERQARGESPPEQRPVAIRKNWKPTIAAVNGIAFGGGFEWAMRCDIRICSTNARFALPEVKRAILPAVGAWKLQRLIPPGVALYYAMTGVEMDAQEAYRLGVVMKVVEPEKLMDEAIALAELICENGPLAVRTVKQIHYEGAEMPADIAASYVLELYTKIHYSEDAKEGPRAFVEKRKPVWKGR